MTATPAATDSPVPADVLAGAPVALTTTAKVKDTPVTLDGHPLLARRPKSSWMAAKQAEWAAIPEEDPRQIDTLHELVEKLFPREEDRAYLYGRLNDEADEFDYEDLDALFQALQERWSGGRPTGRSAGSSSPPRRTGGRSTARRR